MPNRAGDWHCRLTQTRPAAQVASSPGATLYVVAQVPPLAMPPELDEGEKQAFHMQNEPPRPVEAWQSLLLLHESAGDQRVRLGCEDAQRPHAPFCGMLPSLHSFAAAEAEAA